MIKIVHGGLVVCMLVSVISLGMWGCPKYKVYRAEMDGRADSIKAIGTAAANRIIGESLKGNDQFLSWYFMTQAVRSKNQTIYVPSGVLGLPMPEATRLTQQNENQPAK